MTALWIVLAGLAGLAAGAGGASWLRTHPRRPDPGRRPGVGRILLPFTGQAISRRAFEAAVRIALAEDATIMPAFLARVPRHLPLDSSLPAQCAGGMALLEGIEQRASAAGVAVDARVTRGRTYRDALRRLLAEERFDRVIVSATDSPRHGLSPDDLEWLLERVPAEVLILRPAPEDTRRIPANGLAGHF